MANDELKKKIIDMLQSAKRCIGQDCNTCKYKKESANYIGVSCMTLRIADELILNGIGDVWDISEKAEKAIISLTKQYKEAEHRAEVAERALRNAAPRLKCRGGLGEGFCGVDECDYYHCNNDEGCVKAHLRQAERELAEEKNE